MEIGSTLDILLRVFSACMLGFAVGLEREMTNKYAGLRTNILVCLGACLFTIISIYGFPTVVTDEHANGIRDTARVAAQVVTGIGFLGAGIIFFRRESLHGLTTAAIIWCTAAIGMCCGTGMYILASVCALLVIIVQLILHTKPFKKHGQRLLLVRFYNSDELQKTLQMFFGITQFHRYKITRVDSRLVVEAVIRPNQNYHAEKINNFIENNEEMISIERLEDL